MTAYGRNIRISIYGGSHDDRIGVRVSGLPAGIPVDAASVAGFLARRAPGRNDYSSQRHEEDIPEILSGVTNGQTDGNEFHAVIRNTDRKPGDYQPSFIPRPSHADYPAYIKSSGSADLSGGGHFSGRLTAPLCIIGSILKSELEKSGVFIGSHIFSIAGKYDLPFSPTDLKKQDFDAVLTAPFPVIDRNIGIEMLTEISNARESLDSVGGIAECGVIGLHAGVGEHFFDGLESRIASIVFSCPSVKGIEFGSGFGSASKKGSENNDPYIMRNGNVITETNNSGGILGGMSTGMPIVFRVAVKPTPSIGILQKTVNLSTNEETTISVKGRHDPCIVPRILPVIESCAAIAVYDALLDEGEMEK